jgi:type IV secretion system protein VirB11
MGEIRGSEAMSWLRAVGTGHPGSITTVHANSARGAAEQLALMALMSGSELRRSELAEYISDVVDIFIQLGRQEGNRLVTEIDFSGREEVASRNDAKVRLIEGRRFGS